MLTPSGPYGADESLNLNQSIYQHHKALRWSFIKPCFVVCCNRTFRWTCSWTCTDIPRIWEHRFMETSTTTSTDKNATLSSRDSQSTPCLNTIRSPSSTTTTNTRPALPEGESGRYISALIGLLFQQLPHTKHTNPLAMSSNFFFTKKKQCSNLENRICDHDSDHRQIFVHPSKPSITHYIAICLRKP